MHGVKKEARSEARVAEDAKRIAEFRAALEKAESARHAMQEAAEEGARRAAAAAALSASESVLLLNPSHYTMWNARKEALGALGRGEETLPAELRLTARCLQLNPKAYCVWEHRRFCLAPLMTPQVAVQEMALCDKFHGFDARNFHCWNYRRWAAGSAGQGSQEAELAYSLRRIQEDFSNYSAWHARSLAVGRALEGEQETGKGEQLLAREWELLFNGLYTNPADQSLWMYVFWLLPRSAEPQLRALGGHCLQLLELDGEEAGKWPLLCLLRLELDRDVRCGPRDRAALVAALERIDPKRRGYYRSLNSAVH